MFNCCFHFSPKVFSRLLLASSSKTRQVNKAIWRPFAWSPVGMFFWFKSWWKLLCNCWWFRNPAITSWDCAKTLVNNGINYQPQLVKVFLHQQNHCNSSFLGRELLKISLDIQSYLLRLGALGTVGFGGVQSYRSPQEVDRNGCLGYMNCMIFFPNKIAFLKSMYPLIHGTILLNIINFTSAEGHWKKNPSWYNKIRGG